MNNLWHKIQGILHPNSPEEHDDLSTLCPLPVKLDLQSIKRVLIIAPHPDDEVLGCGGLIAKLSKTTDINVILVTDGSGAGELPVGTDAIRQQEMRDSLAILGVNDLTCLNEPDGFFKSSPDFIGKIKKQLIQFDPEWIFIPSIDDFHRDHHRIGCAIIKLAKQNKLSARLFQFEVWNPVSATHVIDITDVIKTKLEALRCHQSILSCAPYEQAITGLAKYRSLYLQNNNSTESFAECYQEHICK